MPQPADKPSEEELAALLSAVREPPASWIDAAKELPAARAEIGSIVARAEADAAFRAEVLDDLERALSEHGHEPSPALIAALRAGVTESR